MAGSFEIEMQGGQYKKGSYKINSKEYPNIHIFTSLGNNQQGIIPMVRDEKTELSAMNPNPALVNANDVIAKINGNVFVAEGPIGINYEGATGAFYVADTQYAMGALDGAYFYALPKFSPTLCVKTNGTAAIRWFSNRTELQAAVDASTCMIATAHVLLFDGKNVFTQKVMDGESVANRRPIYDESNEAGCRHEFNIYSRRDSTARRTLLGHKAGSQGIYIAVCTDSSMTLTVAANLMSDLGCDYAVNLDGNPSVQMRIKSGYAPSEAVGRPTSYSGQKIFAGICFYEK